MGKKKKAQREPVGKDDLLLLVDGAIAHLMSVRRMLDEFMADDVSVSGNVSSDDDNVSDVSSEADPVPDTGPPVPVGCQHAHRVGGGFGSPDFCLDCESDVGVSAEPASEPNT